MKEGISVLLALMILPAMTACSGGAQAEEFLSGLAAESTVQEAAVPEQSGPGENESETEEALKDAEAVDDTQAESSAITQSDQEQSTHVAKTANEKQQSQATGGGEPADNQRIRLSFDGGEAIVSLYDTPIGRELVSRLPLTLEFQDYVGKEKISYLSHALTTQSGSGAPSVGDFAYYSPWGNLAIFYNETASAGNGLIILGSINSGKELLAGIDEDFTMTIELAS